MEPLLIHLHMQILCRVGICDVTVSGVTEMLRFELFYINAFFDVPLRRRHCKWLINFDVWLNSLLFLCLNVFANVMPLFNETTGEIQFEDQSLIIFYSRLSSDVFIAHSRRTDDKGCMRVREEAQVLPSPRFFHGIWLLLSCPFG